MKRYQSLLAFGLLCFLSSGVAQVPVNVQKVSGTNALTGDVVVPSGHTISTSGTGSISSGTSVTTPKIIYTTGVIEVFGSGTPESVVTANIGSVFHRTDGSTGTSLYIKESGTGNTGWTAVASGGGGSPGGSDTQLQYNNSGSFGGISGATSNGTAVTFTAGNLIATSPKIIAGINDTNGNELISFTATTSAVNEFTVTNAATGTSPILSATGGDSDVDININPKGAGTVNVPKSFTILGNDPVIRWFVTSGNLADFPKFRPQTANTDGALMITPSGSATEAAVFLSGNSSPDTTGANTFGFGGGFSGAETGYWNFGSFNRASASSDARPISLLVQNAGDGRIAALHILKTGEVDILRSIASTTTGTGSLTVAGGVGIAGAVNVGGSITASQTGGIVGTTTNNDASAGSVGEAVSSLVAVGSPISLTTATGANITSISLTAGDWDVSGNVNFSASTATVTGTSGGITATSATVPTDGSEVYSGVQVTLLSETDSVTIPAKRFSLSGTTTIYLVGKSTFSAGTVGGFGSITARRRR